MKIVAIVQARISSSRLPGKVLLELGDSTVLGQVFNQLSFSEEINKVVLATSSHESDNLLEDWAKLNEVDFFRGDLSNVLKRFYDAAKYFKADHIVRITADCPLIDPGVVDSVINEYLDCNFDYCSNANPPTFPDGLDAEIFSFKTLETAYQNSTLVSEHEHVTLYIRNHPEIFKIGNLSHEIDLSHHRWTLDNSEDYTLISEIYQKLFKKGRYINWNSVLDCFAIDKELLKINSHIARNEGLIKSLNDEKKEI